jgi:hypothetical protein
MTLLDLIKFGPLELVGAETEAVSYLGRLMRYCWWGRYRKIIYKGPFIYKAGTGNRVIETSILIGASTLLL